MILEKIKYIRGNVAFVARDFRYVKIPNSPKFDKVVNRLATYYKYRGAWAISDMQVFEVVDLRPVPPKQLVRLGGKLTPNPNFDKEMEIYQEDKASFYEQLTKLLGVTWAILEVKELPLYDEDGKIIKYGENEKS